MVKIDTCYVQVSFFSIEIKICRPAQLSHIFALKSNYNYFFKLYLRIVLLRSRFSLKKKMFTRKLPTNLSEFLQLWQFLRTRLVLEILQFWTFLRARLVVKILRLEVSERYKIIVRNSTTMEVSEREK